MMQSQSPSLQERASWDSRFGHLESVNEIRPTDLDFMDEDERRDEIFRMVLQNPHNRHLFPEPEAGDISEDLPPQDIILS